MKELVTTLVVGVLSLSLLSMLVPNSEKTLKYVVSVIFLCMITLPIIKAVPGIKTESLTIENKDISESVLALKTKSTELLIADVLKRSNLDFNKITVFANISDDYSITIKRVEIISNENAEKILSALKELDFEKVVKKYEA